MHNPLKIGWKFKLSSSLLFVAISFFISHSSFAAQNYIIPEICVNHAIEIGVFTDKNPFYTEMALRNNFTGPRTVNFDALDEKFNQSLEALNSQLDDGGSDLNYYLSQCSQASKELDRLDLLRITQQIDLNTYYKEYVKYAGACHGYFVETKGHNPLNFTGKNTGYTRPSRYNFAHAEYANLYCETQMYTKLSAFVVGENDRKIKQLVSNPNSKMISLQDVNTLITLSIRILSGDLQEMGKIYNLNRSQSAMPEGFVFVIDKIDKEFEDIEETKKRVAMISVAEELMSYGELNSSAPKFQFASSGMKTAGQQMADQPDVGMLRFPVKSPATDMMLYRSEEEYWKRRIAVKKPFAMSADEQFSFFDFLSRHPFFYRDRGINYFQNVKLSAKNPANKSNYAIPTADTFFHWNPKTSQLEESEEIKSYKRQVKFKPMGTMFKSSSSLLPGKYTERDFSLAKLHEDGFMQNFIFDLQFRNEYMKSLMLQRNIEKRNEIKNLAEVEWKNIFFQYVPFAFNRSAGVLITRDLARYAEAYAKKNILSSKTSFVGWAEDMMCNPEYQQQEPSTRYFNNIKKDKLSRSYCSAANFENRINMFEKIYDEWRSRKISFVKRNKTKNYQRFYYDQEFLDDDDNGLNPKVLAINDYCWNKRDPSGYAKNPEKYESDAELNNKIENFYAAAGAALINSDAFMTATKFNPNIAAKNCFTLGYAIGPALEKTEYANQLESWANGYQTTLNAKKSNEAKKAFANLTYREKFRPSNFRISKSLMEFIEKKMDHDVIKDMEDTHEAFRKSSNQGKVEEFMKTSVTLHTLATIDYLEEHPDRMVARYFGHLLQEQNTSERVRAQWQAPKNAAIFAATLLVSVGILPKVLSKTAMSVFDGATAAVILVGGAATTANQIYKTKEENKKIKRSLASKSLDPEVEQILKKINSDSVNGAIVQQGVQVALVLVLAGRPLSIFGKYIKKLNDVGYRNDVALVKMNLESFIERTGAQNLPLASDKLVNFLVEKVPTKERNEFYLLLGKNGVQFTDEIEKFMRLKWGDQLAEIPSLLAANLKSVLTKFVERTGPQNAYLASDHFVDFLTNSATTSERAEFLGLLNNRSGQATSAVTAFIGTYWKDELGDVQLKTPAKTILARLGDFLFHSEVFYNIKIKWYLLCKAVLTPTGNPMSYNGIPFYLDGIRLSFLYDRFAMEKSIRDVLNAAISNGRRLGRTIYSDKQLAKYDPEFSEPQLLELDRRLNFYKRDLQGDGRFYRVMESEVEDMWNVYYPQSPYLSSHPEIAKTYLQRALSEQFVDRGQWQTVLSKIDPKEIRSVGDMKCLVEVLKVANGRYGFFRNFRHLGKLIDTREILSGPVFYPNRSGQISDDIVTFFHTARSWKQDSNEYFLNAITNFSKEHDVSIREVLKKIQSLDTRGEIYDLESMLYASRNPVPHITRESLKDNKYALEYWDLKSKDFKNFQKILKKDLDNYLSTTDDKLQAFAQAYMNAKNSIRADKKIRNGCSQVDSAIKGNVGRRYGQFLNSIAASASGINYAVVHNDEEQDMEWWSRGGFEIASAWLVNKMLLSPIYSHGANYSPIVRDFIFYPLTVAAGIALDSTLYQKAIQNNYNNDESYQAEFKRLMYDSPDMIKTVEQFFARHPQVQESLTQNILKLEKFYTDLLKMQKGGITLSEQMIVDSAVKAGIYDKYFADGKASTPTEREILDVMKNYMYQKADGHLEFNPDVEEVYDDDDEFLYDRGAANRAGFNGTVYEPRIALFALAKNTLIYTFLCDFRYVPIQAGTVMALGTYTLYKSGVDIFKFNKRDELIGQ